MKTVAILQSNYIPWKGYFDIVHDVDLFIFYDDVQYTRRDWRNRNKLKTPRGLEWLTIPTNGDREQLIHEVRLIDPNWQSSHWHTIKQFYGKAPFFALYRDVFAEVYLGRKWSNLSALNQYLIQLISHQILGIETEFVDSTVYGATSTKQERILELLRKSEATNYLSGPAAKAYIDEARFEAAGIGLTWKDYSGYPEYSQFHGQFDHGVSILDLLFHTGADAPWYIWGWRNGRQRPPATATA